MKEETRYLKWKLNRMLAEATGQSYEKIQCDTDRDFYLNAEAAVNYGLADDII